MQIETAQFINVDYRLEGERSHKRTLMISLIALVAIGSISVGLLCNYGMIRSFKLGSIMMGLSSSMLLALGFYSYQSKNPPLKSLVDEAILSGKKSTASLTESMRASVINGKAEGKMNESLTESFILVSPPKGSELKGKDEKEAMKESLEGSLVIVPSMQASTSSLGTAMMQAESSLARGRELQSLPMHSQCLGYSDDSWKEDEADDKLTILKPKIKSFLASRGYGSETVILGEVDIDRTMIPEDSRFKIFTLSMLCGGPVLNVRIPFLVDTETSLATELSDRRVMNRILTAVAVRPSPEEEIRRAEQLALEPDPWVNQAIEDRIDELMPSIKLYLRTLGYPIASGMARVVVKESSALFVDDEEEGVENNPEFTGLRLDIHCWRDQNNYVAEHPTLCLTIDIPCLLPALATAQVPELSNMIVMNKIKSTIKGPASQ